MTYNEIYKLDYNRIIMSTQNNLIIVTGSEKQCESQITWRKIT
jgi:hypothetical protein